MAIVRVDLPMKNWWIFHSYVSLPEGNFVMMPNGAYSPSMLHLVTGRQTVQSKVVPHGSANVERGPLQMANTGWSPIAVWGVAHSHTRYTMWCLKLAKLVNVQLKFMEDIANLFMGL